MRKNKIRMHDYGYLHDDVFPLTKEGAREWHRLGEKIYPLFRDGTAGDYVSQEEIEQHNGIFGIKADAWDAILLEQREDYAENEYARPDFKLTVINREQALRLYDEGKQIYLVRISPWPILATAREEIERGSDTFQIAIADLEQERNMTEQENVLLYGNEKQFGIYQIIERDPEHNYRFMGLDYVQKKGMTVSRADYGEATRKMRAFLQGPKPELLHHQKFFENGTAERAKESGTEQNYNMIDGCVNKAPTTCRQCAGAFSVHC